MPQFVAVVILWIVALIPAMFYLFLFRAFRPVLAGRRKEIRSIMSRGGTFKEYLRTFGSVADQDCEKTLDGLFFQTFGRTKYYFPLAILSLVSLMAMVVVLTRAGFDLGIPDLLSNRIHQLGLKVIAGLGGAFIWGTYDALRRYESIDLAPADLHYISLRLVLAPILAPMVTAAFTDSLQSVIAFGIGTFPVATLLNFVKGQARTKLNITGLSEPAEGPTLQYIQGITPTMLQRLQDSGFESVEHLAGADPIKMLLKTNIEWKVILDLMDQAILFGYVGEKLALLRPLGIRGAIELATIQDSLESDHAQEARRARNLVSYASKVLEQDESAVLNMIKDTYEDVQVNFLWSLWGDASLEDGEEAVEEEADIVAPQPGVTVASSAHAPEPPKASAAAASLTGGIVTTGQPETAAEPQVTSDTVARAEPVSATDDRGDVGGPPQG
jgi:hypothetical protein